MPSTLLPAGADLSLNRRQLLALGGLAPFLFTGCKGSLESDIPDDPESLTLFSVAHPESGWTGKVTDRTIYDCAVLGSVDVTDQRREIIASIKSAIRTPEPRKGCWEPRHLLRMAARGRETNLLICFECSGIQLIRDRRVVRSDFISSAPEPLLDAILARAAIPVVPNRH